MVIMTPNSPNKSNTQKPKENLYVIAIAGDNQSSEDCMCHCKPGWTDLVTMGHWTGHLSPNAREIYKLPRT